MQAIAASEAIEGVEKALNNAGLLVAAWIDLGDELSLGWDGGHGRILYRIGQPVAQLRPTAPHHALGDAARELKVRAAPELGRLVEAVVEAVVERLATLRATCAGILAEPDRHRAA